MKNEICYIRGLIDFIFGRGRSIFRVKSMMKTSFFGSRLIIIMDLQSCEVFVITDRRVMEDDSGFVFVEGKVYGGGNACLGRAKGAYSRVVFVRNFYLLELSCMSLN